MERKIQQNFDAVRRRLAKLSLLLEIETNRIDTVAFAALIDWAIIKHVTQMGTAAFADNFGPIAVLLEFNIF